MLIQCFNKHCRIAADIELSRDVPEFMTLNEFVDDYMLKENLYGVSPKYFNNLKNEGVDLSKPRAVGLALKDSNAIVYFYRLKR